jgi:plastocyanin
MNKHLIGLLLAIGLAGLLSSCGGKSATINLRMTDFAYDPAQITVPAGAQITLVATNNGVLEHEFVIMEKGYTVAPPWGEKDEAHIFWELDAIGAGQTKKGTFTAPAEPGEYEIVCGLPAHIEDGMKAILIVK